ncbi:protein of unknown function [uncultured Woeseiaceae bacterium]|uniref:Uncharacterized protein n=1 Tax=uncultured Woeseiaceae bacterium TaxID=1983305 RepID=A0A7D9D3K9_9GAMM|nr:protein of unknown function [uncultured Woeseiaceae bacterium]
MNDNDDYILDIWLFGEGTVRATNAISNPDRDRHGDPRRLSVIISGNVDTNSHPWANTFKKIDVTLYFSDENPIDDCCALLSASEICLEGDVVYRDSLDIEAFLPMASFTMVSQILTFSRSGRPMLYLLTDYDIAAWAAQDEPELLKIQECAFDYDGHTLAAIDEQVPKEAAEQTGVDTALHRRWWRRKQAAKLSSGWSSTVFGALIFVIVILLVLAPFILEVYERML